jgi:hypothetical protein
MNRWRVGEDRGSKETDGCPLTLTKEVHCVPQDLVLREQPASIAPHTPLLSECKTKCVSENPQATRAIKASSMWHPRLSQFEL